MNFVIGPKFISLQSRYQIFYYTRFITQKRVTNLRGLFPPHRAQATQLAPIEEILLRWQAIGNTVSNSTGPRFEPLTSRSRNECSTKLALDQLVGILVSRYILSLDTLDDES